MKCFIDTMTAYIELTTPPRLINSISQWKYFSKTDKTKEHYFNRYSGITCRYYPYRYGVQQLWLTFSIPKLLKGNNLYPLNMTDLDKILYHKIIKRLSDIMDIGTASYGGNIAYWQSSRLDLFLLHKIEPKRRKWYLNAYEKLSIGSYVPYKYENTFYLNSTLEKQKAAGTVVRIYPKLQEIYDTTPHEIIPLEVEKDFEEYRLVNDELVDYIRLEFQFRRPTLRYFFQKSTSVTVADVMQEQFQIERINRMIERLGLHRNIISRRHMKNELDKMFIKQPTKQRAEQYISLVNNRGTTKNMIVQQLTGGQINYIRQKIHQQNLHTVVSEFEDLEPVQFLK